jgi:two-component system sensor histidine kinase CpxA
MSAGGARGWGFPLVGKILLWFFLNLVLLALAFAAMVRWQFGLGLDSLFAGQANRRVQAMAEVIVSELAARPAREWDGVLARSAAAYGVQLALVGPAGERWAGVIGEVPPEVAERLRVPRPPGGFPPGPPGVGGRPGPPPGPPFLGPMHEEGRPFHKSTVRAGNPAKYWVLVRIPARDPERGRPAPGTLVLSSASLGAGGLLFDFAPWIAAGVAAVVLSVLFWLPLVGGIARSIGGMTRVAEEIATGRFEARADARRGDELGRLATSLNRMAARLGEAFQGQKRFLGDTAHELSSPLARMEMALAILEQRAPPEQAGYVGDVRDEVRAMSALVSDLLAFSKATAGSRTVAPKCVPLEPLVVAVVRREAEGKARVELALGDGLGVSAEPDLLSRALANVVRNGVRYAGDAGPIRIAAGKQGGEVVVTVTDCGPGVPPEAVHRLFDPFYRPEAARSRETGGVGLGLAIVKSCVEACGGSVAVRNVAPRGFCVELRLRGCVASVPA